MAEWTETGGVLESGDPQAPRIERPQKASSPSAGDGLLTVQTEGPATGAAADPGAPPRGGSSQLPDASARTATPSRRALPLLNALVFLSNMSVRAMLLSWFGMILGFSLIFWGAEHFASDGLLGSGRHIDADGRGFLTSLYFSFVTATSVGYGDVVPLGFSRAFAIVESAAGLLLFGCLISKLISTRQEQLIEEIHRTTFEDRLGRVRTNLHLVLSEIQATSEMCSAAGVDPERIVTRVESTVMVFSGELRSIHDLLYRRQQSPDEAVLEAILASLASAMRELADLLACLPRDRRKEATLDASLETISRLASEICGECVPRNYAPALKQWMDRIQGLAHSIAASGGLR